MLASGTTVVLGVIKRSSEKMETTLGKEYDENMQFACHCRSDSTKKSKRLN